MRMLEGEVRQIGISVVSQYNESFIINSADFIIYDSEDIIVLQGSATIEEHKIIILFSANKKGSFVCEFTYRIGAEILKARINVSVNTP